MEIERSFGVLVHPTSFPGPWGIGVLGEHALGFLDWLAAAGGRFWQVLPLGPTGYGDSPYQAVSSFAGNPYLIDPEELFERGWLAERELPSFPADWVDYGRIYRFKWQLLRRAFSGFSERAGQQDLDELAAFRQAERFWIEDYSLYKALKAACRQRSWVEWPEALKNRESEEIEQARAKYAEDVDFHAWTQWMFHRQWERVRAHGAGLGIRIIGDIPIFVAHDSPEVWAHPEQFFLNDEGLPAVVAGVPPDYFSETGQLWGNPLYRWEVHQADGFGWWIERLRTVLKTCDLVRIDHFRGFEAYWEVQAGAETAIRGRWVTAPGRELFGAVRAALGDAPIIAEDLGVITPEVEALRDEFGFPGMKVLQFAFDGDENNDFLPHRLPEHGNFLVYPGTHDNETSLGWYRNLGPELRAYVRDYLLSYDLPFEPDTAVPWSLIHLAMHSPARLAVIVLQDVLSLGNEARMNTPSVARGNWTWRFSRRDLTPDLADRLHRLADRMRRLEVA